MHYDLIIIGCGAMGAATLYQAAKRGANVLGIDQYDPPHALGSTHGETRITRLAVGEGPQYFPLVKRSHEIWEEIAAQTGQQLLYLSGLLIIAPQEGGGVGHFGDFVTLSAKIAAQYGLDVTRMSAAEVRAQFPLINPTDADNALLDPNGGIVAVDHAVAAQLQLAEQHGARVLRNTKVLSIDGQIVKTNSQTFTANKIVNTTGSWIKSWLPKKQADHFRVTRQTIYWFAADDVSAFSPEEFPGILWPGIHEDDYLGAFPVLPGGTPGFKVLTERREFEYDPDTVPRDVPQSEIDEFVEVVMKDRILGLDLNNCLKAKVCLYTDTPDDHFIIDWHPENKNMLVVSPCSGHGFKHSAAIGESIVQWMLDGRSEIDLSAFQWKA